MTCRALIALRLHGQPPSLVLSGDAVRLQHRVGAGPDTRGLPIGDRLGPHAAARGALDEPRELATVGGCVAFWGHVVRRLFGPSAQEDDCWGNRPIRSQIPKQRHMPCPVPTPTTRIDPFADGPESSRSVMLDITLHVHYTCITCALHVHETHCAHYVRHGLTRVLYDTLAMGAMPYFPPATSRCAVSASTRPAT